MARAVPIYFRFFIDDYLRDAQELSLLRHGVYLRLMLWYYARAKPIPNDLFRIYSRIGARSQDEEEAAKAVLADFFTLDGNEWRHKRIDAELADWKARSEAARASVLVREEKRLRINSSLVSNDERTIIERSSNQNQNHKELKPKTLKPLSSSQANIDALTLLNFLNEKASRAFRPTATTLKPIVSRLKEGYSLSDCKAVIVRRCRAWGVDDKMRPYLRPATIFGAEKFAQYIGEVPIGDDDGN